MQSFVFFILFFLQLALAFMLGQMVEMQRSRRQLNAMREINDEIFSIARQYRDKVIELANENTQLREKSMANPKPLFKSKPLKKK